MKRSGFGTVYMIVVFSALCVCGTAVADSSGYGFFAGYGQSRDNIDIFRLGVQKKFSTQWFETHMGSLSGYFELSYNRWEKSGKQIHGAAFSPVFAYYFNTGSSAVTPYVEGGIGAAYIDDYKIDGRNLSTSFQFEDRISLGVIINQIDLKLGYMHYSNASIKSPNDGIDIWMGTVTWHF
ncbi:MAG: acyloxyacyl hydrolase [Desulfotignum sp.]|nr:acyloxyacyl hydrolase [Desulfotignum sp.]